MAGSVVTVTPVSAGESVVTVTATDAGGSNRTATQTFTVTVAQDADGDGLIGIHTPAQLDAVRHDLDGDGAPTTAGAAGHAAVFGVTGGGTLSCAVAGGRRGYELRADLDFDTNGGGGPDAGGRLGGRQRRSGDGQLRHRAAVGNGGGGRPGGDEHRLRGGQLRRGGGVGQYLGGRSGRDERRAASRGRMRRAGCRARVEWAVWAAKTGVR